MRPKVFKSTSTGDLSFFAAGLKDRDLSVSIMFDDGFDFSDTSDFRVHMQIEPPEVLERMHAENQKWTDEKLHSTLDTLIYNHEFFDLILTWNERVLEACPNAVLFPQALCTWVDPCYLPFCGTQTKESNAQSFSGDDHDKRTDVL